MLAVLAAAFLAGLVVGSAQAAPGRAEGPALATPGQVPSQTPPDEPVDVSVPSWPESHSHLTPEQLNEPPACTFADERRGSDPWRVWNSLVLDTATTLRATDVPPDLVDAAQAGLDGGHLVRRIVIDDLRAMAQAARAAGAGLAIQSAYRSYAEQAQTFTYWVAAVGRREALARSARPGHSEHQLGTTIDFTSRGAPPWAGRDWARTRAGGWLLRHAWHYGFVMSYPRDARDVTCYGYEPWHYRYVGRRAASTIHASGLTPREWLLR
jgi:zinc D-Ala-D-Ala carboxypeptidase